jgi:4-amino-4-deoxy-L-arabinose transferase
MVASATISAVRDERFHALVARNLIHHPLTPTWIENPVLPYDFKNWTANPVWLEKGPVPLWALSGSIRVLGADELAVRIPSIPRTSLAVYLTFLIAATLFDRDVAILAAFFQAINGLLVELAAGRVSSDHVDTFPVLRRAGGCCRCCCSRSPRPSGSPIC